MKLAYCVAALVGSFLLQNDSKAADQTIYAQSLGQLYISGINNVGHLIASSSDHHNYLLQPGSTIDLGDFAPQAINNNDEILGTEKGRNAIWRAGVVTLLPEFTPDGRRYDLKAINDSGVMAGTTYQSANIIDNIAIKYGQGIFTPLGYGCATSINNSGSVVGASACGDIGSVAVLWSNDTRTVLNRRDPDVVYGEWQALHISDSGTVISFDELGFYVWKNGIYTAAPDQTSLYSNSDAMAVGERYFSNGTSYGAIFKDGSLIDVNSLVITPSVGHISALLKVTESGYMIGYNSTETVVLSPISAHYIVPTVPQIPIPEPSTYLTLLTGLGMLGLIKRRKQAQ